MTAPAIANNAGPMMGQRPDYVSQFVVLDQPRVGLTNIFSLGTAAVRHQNSTPNVLVMQPAQDRNRDDVADGLGASEVWGVFA
jgi:hypothetical protein